MNRIIFFLILLWVSAATTMNAQVSEFSIDAANNSIIRSIGNNHNLILLEKSNGINYFVLHDDSSPTAQIFAMPSEIRVHDVGIWKGQTAFFCGTYIPLNEGVVGFFDIADVFSGIGVVNYCRFTYNPYSFFTRATDFKRLSLYEVGTTACVALVGDAWFDNILNEPTSTVASAYFNGVEWLGCTYLRKPHAVHFTDVACLDNTIVTVASDINNQFCFIKTFFRTVDFPLYPCALSDFVAIDYGNPFGDVLTTQMVADTVAVAHINKEMDGRVVIHKVPIDNITGLPVFPIETWTASLTSPVTTNTNLLELTALGNRVWLLQNAALHPTTGTDHWLMDVTLNSPATTTPMSAYHPSFGLAQSFDFDITLLNPRLSGSNGRLLLYLPVWNTPTGNCSLITTATMPVANATRRLYKESESAESQSYNNQIHIPFIDEISSTIICFQ